MPPVCEFIRLTNRRRYTKALRRLRRHPEEVTAKDESGLTALTKLCCDTEHTLGQDGMALAQAMVDIRPELVTDDAPPTYKSNLMHALSRGPQQRGPRSIDLALLLIRANPNCVRLTDTCNYEYTSFHTVCGPNTDIVVLRAMLEACPEVASAITSNGLTPVDVLLRRNGWDIEGHMDKVALILLTNFKGRVVDDPLPMHQLVHAVCCYPRPLAFLTRIMKMFPEQVHQPDEHGRLPLHYAVKNVGMWDDSDRPFVHSNFVFQKLMKVVRAAPQALMTLDPTDGLYPALTSATRADQCNIHLSVTYQLLLTQPQIVSHAIPTTTADDDTTTTDKMDTSAS